MWFNKTLDQVLKKLDVNPCDGLSSSEASIRLQKYGENKLVVKKKKSLLKLFFEQINNVMIYILLAAAVVSFLVNEVSDSIIIIIVVLINSIIGVLQESKAEKALEALKKLSTPKAIVKRDSSLIEIASHEVTLGDIVILDAGRYIPADLRLIESSNLKVDESAFTGESTPALKDANFISDDENLGIGDRHNMVYMSTLVSYGRGVGIVTAIGMDTEIGHIASMIENEQEDLTPLQKRLDELGRILGFGALAVCLIIFIMGLFQKRDLFQMLLTSISLAVAAIPEGLPAIVAIVLAMGVQKMIKKNAIIRKLPAVETLGSVSIICSDKTGTLTQNKMTVTKYFSNNSLKVIKDINTQNITDHLLLECMILCNDATYSKSSKTGDPTEIALLESAYKFNEDFMDLNSSSKRVNEIPFDSDRKLMSTLNEFNDSYRVYTKGAIDSILKVCTYAFVEGTKVELDSTQKSNILSAVDTMSNDALRVLAFAYKNTESKNETESFENELIFIGMVGMIDPPRLEVKESIQKCINANITPIMITGDYKNTAFAIAKELGIAKNIDESISGSDIDKMNDTLFNEKILNYKVFARVSPAHKVRIVKAFKSHGNIVSMTGDGVNDAPSLKASDIGVAMGVTGTDVAKGASDMILTDDNFKTIVCAVEEGRNIYNNIKKSILFLLSCNLGEILTLFVAILFNFDAPLLPIHILWVNLITDSFPALALGVDPSDPSLMDLPPRRSDESILNGHSKLFLVLNGVLIGGLTLFAFKFSEKIYPGSLRHAQTMAFVVLSVSQLFFSLAMRNTKKSLFKIGIFKNKYLVYSILFGIFLQVIVITVPQLASIFKVYPLSFNDWITVIGISLIPLIVNEILKFFLKKD